MEHTKIKVLFVDDNKRLMSAWERLFAQQPDMKLVAALDRADDLCGAVQRLDADVVLIDLMMEGRDPLDAITELKRSRPRVRALVYSGHSRSDWQDRARQAGADDFVDKTDDPNDVLEAIRRVCQAIPANRPPHAAPPIGPRQS